jgi:hypothetical protein
MNQMLRVMIAHARVAPAAIKPMTLAIIKLFPGPMKNHSTAQRIFPPSSG